MAERGFFEEFSRGFADAIADIREKVVEEPWFGRVVTERGGDEVPQWPQAQEPEQSFGSVTHTIDVGPTHEQVAGNANYRLAAMERELNGTAWPQAVEPGKRAARAACWPARIYAPEWADW